MLQLSSESEGPELPGALIMKLDTTACLVLLLASLILLVHKSYAAR